MKVLRKLIISFKEAQWLQKHESRNDELYKKK